MKNKDATRYHSSKISTPIPPSILGHPRRKFWQNRYYKLSIFLEYQIAHDCLFFVYWLSKSIGYRCFRIRLNARCAESAREGLMRNADGDSHVWEESGRDLRDRTISVSRKRVTRAKLLRKFHGRWRKKERERGGKKGEMGSLAEGDEADEAGGSSMDRGAVEKGAHTLKFWEMG